MDESRSSAGGRRSLLPLIVMAIGLAAVVALIVFPPRPPGPVTPDPVGRKALHDTSLKVAGPTTPAKPGAKRERESCTSPLGKPPILNQSPLDANAAALWPLIRDMCFGVSTGTDTSEADSISHPVLGVRLLLMPEKRMLEFDPKRLKQGQGVIVAVLENWDPTSDLDRPGKWQYSVRQEEEAYLYYGLDQNSHPVSVLFKFVKDQPGRPRPLVIAQGSWNEEPHSYPGDTPFNKKRLMARWIPFHPLVAMERGARFFRVAHAAQPDGAAREEGGPGWVSCLRGCCPSSAVFE